jgi:hypothetical protein
MSPFALVATVSGRWFVPAVGRRLGSPESSTAHCWIDQMTMPAIRTKMK